MQQPPGGKPTLQSEYWYRLAYLVFNAILPALKSVLHNDNNEKSYHGLPRDEGLLYIELSTKHKQKIDKLLKDNVIKKVQYDLLLPATKLTKSENFDVTLTVFLIRNLLGLHCSAKGWDSELLQPNDNSLAAYVIRSKDIRNFLSHTIPDNITSAIFQNKLSDVEQIINHLNYQCDLPALKVAPLEGNMFVQMCTKLCKEMVEANITSDQAKRIAEEANTKADKTTENLDELRKLVERIIAQQEEQVETLDEKEEESTSIMAAGGSLPLQIRIKKYENYYRLKAVVHECLQPALLSILHNIGHTNTTPYIGLPSNPHDLFNALCQPSHQTKLRRLLQGHVISQEQYDKLFPPNQHTESKDMDITLQVILIRNFVQTLPPPSSPNGWSARIPLSTDTSLASNVIRIRNFRNYVAHCAPVDITPPIFQMKWDEADDILKDIGYTTDLALLKTVNLDDRISMLQTEFTLVKEIVDKQEEKIDKLDQRTLALVSDMKNKDGKRLNICMNIFALDDKVDMFGDVIHKSWVIHGKPLKSKNIQAGSPFSEVICAWLSGCILKLFNAADNECKVHQTYSDVKTQDHYNDTVKLTLVYTGSVGHPKIPECYHDIKSQEAEDLINKIEDGVKNVLSTTLEFNVEVNVIEMYVA